MRRAPLALLALLTIAAACTSGDDAPCCGEPTPTPTTTPTATPTPTPSGCVSGGLTPGDQTVDCDGHSYEVRMPATCPTAGCGVVLDVHGFTMSGDMEDANTQMRALGEANGYVVVQPNANGSPASWSEADYAKVYAFVLDVMTLGVDEAKIHVTGFSQGGQMTFAMICRYPELWASAAPGAAAGMDCFSGGTPPATRMPVLQIHGTTDALVPFSAATAQRDAVISAWGLGAGTSIGSGSGWSRTRYENAGGDRLEFLQHDYTAGGIIDGHCYPGSTDPGGLPNQLFSFACTPPNGFVYGDEVMAFFLAHPKAGAAASSSAP